MIKNRKLIDLCLIAVMILVGIMVSGCTQDTIGNSVPVTPVHQHTHQPTIGTSMIGDSSINVPWPQDENPIPPYSEEEKQSLVEEAKREIVRMFPNVEEDTLNNYSWEYRYYNNYIVLTLVFTDVVDNSKSEERKALSKYFNKKTVRIRYDPERGIIRSYIPDGTIGFSPDNEIIVSSEEAKGRALEFYKMVMGDESEAHKDDLIIIRDDGEDKNKVFLNVEICTIYKGVVCSYDCSNIIYDLRLDEVRDFTVYQSSPEIMSQIISLSPKPDITIDEAKNILEKCLKENNGGTKVPIEYCQRLGYYDFPNLQWFDNSIYMSIEDGYVTRPIKLIWELPYITTDNGRMHYGIIDAHTGEIIDIQS